MAEYIKRKKVLRKYPNLDFHGAFTTVAVTNGISDIMHTDRNDVGLTWVLPFGEFEGGNLRIPHYGIEIPIKEGEAIAFQANFVAHMSSPLVSGERLALTCFTDRNIMMHSQRYWKKKGGKQ
jgi:hypothetical protein